MKNSINYIILICICALQSCKIGSHLFPKTLYDRYHYRIETFFVKGDTSVTRIWLGVDDAWLVDFERSSALTITINDTASFMFLGEYVHTKKSDTLYSFSKRYLYKHKKNLFFSYVIPNKDTSFKVTILYTTNDKATVLDTTFIYPRPFVSTVMSGDPIGRDTDYEFMIRYNRLNNIELDFYEFQWFDCDDFDFPDWYYFKNWNNKYYRGFQPVKRVK